MSLLLSFVLTPAFGCSMMQQPSLTLDPSLEDDIPPEPPEVIGVEVKRGRGPRDGMSTSCDDLGFIYVTVARPDGDPDGDDVVGYRMEQLEGTLPVGLTLPDRNTDTPWLGPQLRLDWIDGAHDDQDPFDFTVALIPVDLAGNEGSPVTLKVEDDGIADALGAGCSAAPGSVGLLGGLLLVAATRRRS